MPPTAGTAAYTGTQEAAFLFCERLAKTHYENFTVGSWLLPKEKRRHVYAIYAYCRTVDDLGDEATPDANPDGGGLTESPSRDSTDSLPLSREAGLEGSRTGVAGGADENSHRLALLDGWQTELEACYDGTPTHPVMVALKDTINTFDIPPEPFLKLIEANRMDQRIKRYPSFSDLLRYCDHSANPVGHLLLYLFGYRDQERQRLADATCTALQLTNFWQDVARDYRKGRIYIPGEDLERFGYTEEELAQGIAKGSFRQLLALQIDRTKELFQQGADLVNKLEGSVKLDVALFTRGGLAVLDAIQRRGYDVLSSRPALSRSRKAGLALSTWLGWKLGLGLGLPASAEPKLTKSKTPGR